MVKYETKKTNKMEKLLGGVSLEDYEIIGTKQRKCDKCEIGYRDCVKLLFASQGYVCARPLLQ